MAGSFQPPAIWMACVEAPPGLSAAGGSVGFRRAAEALEGLVGERPVGRLLAGAGGTADGGDGRGSGRRRPTGRAKMPDVGGETRGVERPGGLSRAVLNFASGSALCRLRGRPCYATSATKLSDGASASRAPTRCRRSR